MRLVEEYWGPTDPIIPIRSNSQFLQGIKTAAFEITRATLNPRHQEDATEAMGFLFDQLAEFESQLRTEQYNALFRVYLVPFHTCQVCGVETESRENTDVGIAIDVLTQHNTVDDAIQYKFRNDPGPQSACHSDICNGANTVKDQLWVLRAAPRILRVTLLLFNHNPVTNTYQKNMHALKIGEELDLTQYQECKGVPLKYRLSAVVPHSGPRANAGHYVASVRSQGENPYYNINDRQVGQIDGAAFTANPQRPPGFKSAGFQAYILTYIRDEAPLEQYLREHGPR
ncbi:Ubiquitin carboxyl-terminal hydrolase 26 [Paraconiothyrium brasiliense]|uniref:Ubiquitin carboxyl-terminal hydrolase 26 n=1 Tax=Paraconiothyrium brasiliense TaxID=300254 RepID=A0ABR3RAH6_9PLEO